MTLNNYGRTKEVLFTSSLSYLLNPSCDHGLGSVFLNKFLKQLQLKVKKDPTVSPEKDLKGNGNIDIFIEADDSIIGIEAKIWDDSAVNNSKNNEAQLERYCRALKNEKKKWILIFLIPYKDAPICIEEFEKINDKFSKNIKLLSWNYSNEKSSLYENYYLSSSVHEMVGEIINDSTIDITERTQWILKSMYNYIPNFIKQEKSKSRFPSNKDLKDDCSELFNNLIFPFCETLKKYANPIHTTIGFPYGTPPDKSEFGNTLFRIRTTQKYYENIEEKKENYPDKLVIEIWPKVFDKIKNDDDWKKWISEIDNLIIKEDSHINGKEDEKVILLEIDKDRVILPKQVEEFNKIMKRGFEEVINQK